MTPPPALKRVLLSACTLFGVLALPGAQSASAAASKVTICHRTHSTTNPYRRITVSQNAIVKNNGHGDQGASNTHNKASTVNPTRLVFDATYTYPANEKVWDDIIPDATAGGSASIAQNFSGRGLAIYNGTSFDSVSYANACKKMTAKEFYDTEIAAGQTPEEVLADLDEQSANEDNALKAALGGTFVGKNPTTFDTLISATTSAATNLTSSTARLNGSLVLGPTTHTTHFRWGTSPTLLQNQVTAATPSSGSSTVVVQAALSDLLPATTYYFRVIGISNAGTDLESEIQGNILSFTTPAPSATTTPTSPTTTPGTTIPGSTTPTTPGSTTPTVPASTTPATTAVPISTPAVTPGKAVSTDPTGATTEVPVTNESGRIRVGDEKKNFQVVLNNSAIAETTELTLQAGGSTTITGDGFKAGSTIEVWLMSAKKLLTTVTANADGTFSARINIPAALSGDDALQVEGIDVTTAEFSLTYGVTVAAAKTEVPYTGPGLSTALLFLALVAGALGAVLRRRAVS